MISGATTNATAASNEQIALFGDIQMLADRFGLSQVRQRCAVGRGARVVYKMPLANGHWEGISRGGVAEIGRGRCVPSRRVAVPKIPPADLSFRPFLQTPPSDPS